MSDLAEELGIDFVILADRVEAISGKLYMMGGAWDHLNVLDFNQPVGIGFAIGVLVPWTETNIQHPVKMWMENADGTRIPPGIDAGVNVGRPPHSITGQSFRALLAVNGAWKLPGPGAYRVMVTVGPKEPRRTVFYAVGASVQSPSLPQP